MNIEIRKDVFVRHHRQVPDKLIDEICNRSTEEHIKEHTPKDMLERFTDRDRFMRWWQKGKVLYSLHVNDDLGGIIWFTSPFQAANVVIPPTFAIRLYTPALHQGLAKPFMRVTHEEFMANCEIDTIWLSVDNNNNRARKLYEDFGYFVISESTERTHMVYDRNRNEV